MREAINFTFNGISSEEMGVIIVSTDSGLFQDLFLPKITIKETKTVYRDIPYYQGVDLTPLSFSLSLYIHEWQERNKLRQIARWLFQPHYCPLIFDTQSDQVFYAMIEGDSQFIHNGCKDGYITVNIRTNSPFSYSQTKEFDDIQSRTATGVTRLSLFNEGDLPLMPRFWITKTTSNGSITIENESSNQIVTFNDITTREELFIDFENEEIVSSLEYENIYRYENHNNVWLHLPVGENHLKLTGNFDLRIELEYIYLTTT